VWAFDPVSVLPDGEAITGVHTWQLYGARWERSNDDRHYVCAVLVQIDGEPVACDAEDGCEHAWSVTPTLLESDCAAGVWEDPLFVSLQRLALGGVAPGAVPYPGQTLTSYADYGGGWEVHGHAYPEALDQGQPAAEGWDGSQAFLWLPTLAFPLP
jgi:hypothetical protein